MGNENSQSAKILRKRLDAMKIHLGEKGLDEFTFSLIAKSVDDCPSENDIKYFERLISELESEANAKQVLLYMNFNSRKYFLYWVQVLTEKLGTDETNIEKLDRLLLEQKMNNQLPCEFNLAFSVKYPSLKEMIADWLTEEILFLERSSRLTSVSQSMENVAKPGFKLEFDMSVSQFAYFIKSFIETGIIQNKNVSELIRFLAKFVKTKRSENISYESFRMKYYNVESNTKDVVKNTLHNAIGYINRN